MKLEIIAIIISALSLIGTVFNFIFSLQRERKQATLNTFNVLQEQVLDNLNIYTKAQIEEIALKPNGMEYIQLTRYLARMEHFAVGVNCGIYNHRIVKRLAGRYFCNLWDKLLPLVERKRCGSAKERHYDELETMIQHLQALYGQDAELQQDSTASTMIE